MGEMRQPGDHSKPCLLCGQRGTYPVGFIGPCPYSPSGRHTLTPAQWPVTRPS